MTIAKLQTLDDRQRQHLLYHGGKNKAIASIKFDSGSSTCTFPVKGVVKPHTIHLTKLRAVLSTAIAMRNLQIRYVHPINKCLDEAFTVRSEPGLTRHTTMANAACHSPQCLAVRILNCHVLLQAQGLISVQNRQLSDAHRSHSQHLHTVHDINSHRQPEILHKIRPEQLQNVYKQQHPKSHRDAEAEIKEEATQLEEEIKHMELGEGLQRKNQDLLKHAAARSGGNEGKIEHGEKARADEEETLGQITSAQGTTRNLLRMGDSMPGDAGLTLYFPEKWL